MAAVDVVLQGAMMTYVIPALLLGALLYWLWYKGAEVKKRLLAKLVATSKMMHEFHAFTFERRKNLMKDIEELVSKDEELRNKGIIRILEVGVGGGANFGFYPKNCHFVALDPNEHFVQYLSETLGKWPHVHLEKFVVGKAEDMRDIEDESVDVVVETHVLCSVDNVEKALREIKRVLAKGGKFYFMDHVVAPEGSWIKFFQTLVYYPWYNTLDCDLMRDIKKHVESCGFSEVDLQDFQLEVGVGMGQVVQYHVNGVATK